MSIVIKQVTSRHNLKTFVLLPEKLYQNHPAWVPPLFSDEMRFFDPKHNESFVKHETIMALAWRQNKPVGRIMGIINPQYNKSHNELHARFCFLDCENDPDVLNALIRFVEQWAYSKGMTHLVGPMGFSDKDPQGFMVEGFGERPVIATNPNPEFLPQMIQKQGFEKLYDLVSYLIPVPEHLPERYQNALKRLRSNKSFQLVEFDKKKQLKPWIVPVFRLINQAYTNIYGFDPLTDREMHELAKRYLPILDPKFVKLVVDTESNLLAFIIGMPEISEGIRKARGRIFPFGWWHILREWRTTKLLTLLLGAVHPDRRNHGLTLLLTESILNSARKRGITLIDSHLILEYNQLMRAEYERLNGRLHKRFRIYIRPISVDSALA